MEDSDSEGLAADSGQEKITEFVTDEWSLTPDVVRSDALGLAIWSAILITLTVIMIQFMDYLSDYESTVGLQLPGATDFLGASVIGLMVGFGVYIGFIIGVERADRYGEEAEAWRNKLDQLQQYRQSAEYAQKIAESKRSYKKSDHWFVAKIWIGFCALMLVLIFAINIFQ